MSRRDVGDELRRDVRLLMGGDLIPELRERIRTQCFEDLAEAMCGIGSERFDLVERVSDRLDALDEVMAALMNLASEKLGGEHG